MRSCTSAMKAWKWTRRLRSDRERLEEQVHQHGLAAADRAPDVEPARRRGVALAEQPAQRARLAGEPVAAQALGEGFELAQKRDLRRVALDAHRCDESVVPGRDGFRGGEFRVGHG